MSVQKKRIDSVTFSGGQATITKYLHEAYQGNSGAVYLGSFAWDVDSDEFRTVKKVVSDAIKELLQHEHGDKWQAQIKNYNLPLVKGEDLIDEDPERYGDDYKGKMVLKTTTKQPPVLYGTDKKPLPPTKKIDSGDVCAVNVAFTVYKTKGNKGVGCWLNGVMIQKRAEPGGPFTSNRMSGDEMFKGVEAGKPEDDNFF